MSFRLHSPGPTPPFSVPLYNGVHRALEGALAFAVHMHRPVHVIDTTQGLVTVIQPPGSWDAK